ncbi:MAG TPA: AI-2E family transporter [Pirellulales bacterium]|jgi:predicted PurR-regulated permease PerM|nr:AI-2E family transporter [Pirellulales bacterium]
MTRLALHTATVLAVLLAALLIWKLRYPAVLFLLSLATAAALRPLVEYLRSRGWPKTLAVGAVYVQLLAAVALVIGLSAQPLVGETQRFGALAVSAYDHVMQTWPLRGGWREMLARQLPHPEEIYQTLVGDEGISWMQSALGMTFSLFSNLIDALVAVVMSIYWTIDRDHFERLWLSILPARQRIAARDVWRSVEIEAGDYLRSEIVQCLIAGFLLWGGLSVLGHPFPTEAAFLGAVAWLVPWLGMLLAAAIVVVLGLPTMATSGIAHSMPWLVGSVAYTVVLLMALELFVEPRVFGRRRYNSLWIAVVMIGMGDVLGIVGLVLGPPLAATIQILTARLLRQRLVGEAVHTEGDVTAKIAWLRNELAENDQASPELASMVERLKAIVRDAEPVLTEAEATTSEPADAMAPSASGLMRP